MLAKKPKKLRSKLTIQLYENMRTGTVKIGKKTLNMKCVDLPTIVESNKTTDGVYLLKIGDIHQMMVCENQTSATKDQVEEQPTKRGKKKTSVEDKFEHPHGLSAPLKNVRKKRFRKTLHNEVDLETSDVEKEVKRLLKMDNEAVCDMVLIFSFEKRCYYSAVIAFLVFLTIY